MSVRRRRPRQSAWRLSVTDLSPSFYLRLAYDSCSKFPEFFALQWVLFFPCERHKKMSRGSQPGQGRSHLLQTTPASNVPCSHATCPGHHTPKCTVLQELVGRVGCCVCHVHAAVGDRYVCAKSHHWAIGASRKGVCSFTNTAMCGPCTMPLVDGSKC